MTQREVADYAQKIIEHDMIRHYTELPKLARGRAELMSVILKQLQDKQEGARCDVFPLATMLVQIGLDTHDLVSETDAGQSRKFDRTTQLRVLAGDYFSSRFYELLSEAGHIDWVKLLSDAICEVNRVKVNLYMKMKQLKLTAEEYIRQSALIRSMLFTAFDRSRTNWAPLLEMYTLCEVAADEYDRAENRSHFRHSWAYWFLLQNGTSEERKMLKAGEPEDTFVRRLLDKYDVQSRLAALFEANYRLLAERIGNLDPAALRSEVARIVEPLAGRLMVPKVL